MRKLRISKSLITGLVASALAASAWCQPSKLEVLNREEQTWHKFSLFREAMQPKTREDYAVTIDWLRSRILGATFGAARGGADIDSRYPITYSRLLWGSPTPSVRDTSMAYAFVGKIMLDLESARCKNNVEASRLASQWIPAIREQLETFDSLPANRRKELGDFAMRYARGIKPSSSPDHRQGDRWQCTLLQSYMLRISRLDDVQMDSVAEGAFKHVFVSHLTVLPDFASEDEFELRKRAIFDAARSRIDRE